MNSKFNDLLFRSWYYFRTGYAIYIAFFIGFFGNIVVIYKLGVLDVAFLRQPPYGLLFQSLTTFTLVALLVTVPASIWVGWFHMKRTGAFAAETAVAVESNPYVYKVAPGKEKEVILPLMILTARGLAKVMDQEKMITADEKREFDTVLAKANSLLEGQVVGLPRQRDLLREVRERERQR